jgi:predicted phosphoribosyltransferase
VRKFADRRAAGRELAGLLGQYGGRDDVVVVGLPRGGVPVACEVAVALAAPLDVLLVRKLGVPGHEELAFGAIASGGVDVRNDDVLGEVAISPARIAEVVERERRELDRREHDYRGDRSPVPVDGRTVVAVDDGLATGATMRAAIRALRLRNAAAVVVAVPVAASATCQELARSADAVVCARTPDPFVAVGLWYDDFAPTTDEEVSELLQQPSEP